MSAADKKAGSRNRRSGVQERKLLLCELVATVFALALQHPARILSRQRADRIKPLVDWVQRCFPGVNTQSVVPWAGLRPMLPNMLPRVGRGRSPCVFYNTGHGHLGWTLSAITAHQLAGHVDGWARQTQPVLHHAQLGRVTG